MFRKKKRLLWLRLLVIAVLACTGLTALDIWTFGNRDNKEKADVIIVLGAAAYESGVSPVFEERINHAADLYRDGYADYLILTGGVAEGNHVSDAWIALQYAEEIGLSEDVIILEEDSTVTLENMKYSRAIMDEHGWRTAVIVSDPLHMRRAFLMAEACGIKAYSSPTPTSRYRTLNTQLPFLFRETFYVMAFRLCRMFGIRV